MASPGTPHEGRGDEFDLGNGHRLRFADWNPDLGVNPQLAHLAGQFPARVSAIVAHKLPGIAPGTQGGYCEGMITFDTPIARAHFPGPYWTVESWEPLTFVAVTAMPMW